MEQTPLTPEEENLKQAALRYHQYPVPGKIAVMATKPMINQRDLSLAYSPGVAYASLEIQDDPMLASQYTARSNLVAVISNGTAVLGLGNIGALASKPVMEGKGVLFKKFAGIDVFDIEIDEKDPEKLIDIIASLEPTFGGINLEDIKAPECFYIEQTLKKRMKIPVFHDDQHGTAIVTAAGMINALSLVHKPIESVKLVCSGAGAAAISCLNLLVHLGLKKEHIIVCDSKGVINAKRDPSKLDETKKAYLSKTSANTLAEALQGADIFLGLSGPGVINAQMVKSMAKDPIIFALANPTPEILPEEALAARPDAILATGRSDYPNQINNVLCFPYLFRGALDCGATEINAAMEIACVKALAQLAHEAPTEEVLNAYGNQSLHFGREYLIPKPFDSRLILRLPIAVAKAAMESNIAMRPIEDMAKYRETLSAYVVKSSFVMKPIFDQAKLDPKTIVYSEGEDERILQAVAMVKAEGLANPVLIGRPEVIQAQFDALSGGYPLKVIQGDEPILKDPQLPFIQIIDIHHPPHLEECVAEYHRLMSRKGITPEVAKQRLLSRGNILAAILLRQGYVDGEICGRLGQYHHHLRYIQDILGLQPKVRQCAALSAVLSPKGVLFFCDTHVNECPDAETLAQIVQMAAAEVRRFGITPKVALLSHSNFGSRTTQHTQKLQKVLALLEEQDPALEVEGEMQPDLALSESHRLAHFPHSKLSGSANLLIFPDIDSANLSYNLIRSITDSVVIGPILMGIKAPAQILTNAATTRRIINMTAITVLEAQQRQRSE